MYYTEPKKKLYIWGLTVLRGSWLFDIIHVQWFVSYKFKHSSLKLAVQIKSVDAGSHKILVWIQNGYKSKITKINNKVCVLLTGLPAAFSQYNNCVLAQADFRNAEKKNFQTAFINIYKKKTYNWI